MCNGFYPTRPTTEMAADRLDVGLRNCGSESLTVVR